MRALHTEIKAPPPRPPTVFFIWSKANMDRVMKKLPHITDKQLMSLLEKIWNKLSPRAKKPYYEQERRLRAQWMEDVLNWEAMESSRRLSNCVEDVYPFSQRVYPSSLDPILANCSKEMNPLFPPQLVSKQQDDIQILSAIAAARKLPSHKASQFLDDDSSRMNLQLLGEDNLSLDKTSTKTSQLPISNFLKGKKGYLSF